MSIGLSKIATEVARRWIAARERLAKRGVQTSPATIDDMREFAAGIAEEADTFQLDMIADLALAKVGNFDLKTRGAA